MKDYKRTLSCKKPPGFWREALGYLAALAVLLLYLYVSPHY